MATQHISWGFADYKNDGWDSLLYWGFNASAYNILTHNGTELATPTTGATIDAFMKGFNLIEDMFDIDFTYVSDDTNDLTILAINGNGMGMDPSSGQHDGQYSYGHAVQLHQALFISNAFDVNKIGVQRTATYVHLHEMMHYLGDAYDDTYHNSDAFKSVLGRRVYNETGGQGVVSLRSDSMVQQSLAQNFLSIDIDIMLSNGYAMNQNTRIEDTVYKWDEATGDLVFASGLYNNTTQNFVLNTPFQLLISGDSKPILQSLWDAAGRDMLDFSAWNSAIHVNLNPDSWSRIGELPYLYTELTNTKATGEGNLYLPKMISVEDLRGGGNNDVLIGNDVANVIYGNGGDDVINGMGGNDIFYDDLGSNEIHGGQGYDTLKNFDEISLTQQGNPAPWDKIISINGSGGKDRLTSVELLVGTNGDNEVIIDQSTIALVHDKELAIDGGDGYDTLRLNSGFSSFTIAKASQSTFWSSKGYSFRNFEIVIGSEQNDYVTSNGSVRKISLENGNDTVYLEEIAPFLDGGSGNNTLDASKLPFTGIVSGKPLGVAFNAATGSLSQVNSTATAMHFNNFIGTARDDVFVGSSEANIVKTGGASDTIYFSAGNDIIDGGIINSVTDNDKLVFSGNRSAYEITRGIDKGAPNADFVIASKETQGVSYVTEIESFVFADGTRTESNVLQNTNPQTVGYKETPLSAGQEIILSDIFSPIPKNLGDVSTFTVTLGNGAFFSYQSDIPSGSTSKKFTTFGSKTDIDTILKTVKINVSDNIDTPYSMTAVLAGLSWSDYRNISAPVTPTNEGLEISVVPYRYGIIDYNMTRIGDSVSISHLDNDGSEVISGIDLVVIEDWALALSNGGGYSWTALKGGQLYSSGGRVGDQYYDEVVSIRGSEEQILEIFNSLRIGYENPPFAGSLEISVMNTEVISGEVKSYYGIIPIW